MSYFCTLLSKCFVRSDYWLLSLWGSVQRRSNCLKIFLQILFDIIYWTRCHKNHQRWYALFDWNQANYLLHDQVLMQPIDFNHSRDIYQGIQYIPRNMHTVFALLCFVVVIHWLIFPYPSDLLHWHCGNLTIAPVPAKQPWWIWINTLCEFIMNDCITTTKQSTTKPCAYFLGYTVQQFPSTFD